jgi:hypothetical protein
MPGGSKICRELSRITRCSRQRAYHNSGPGRSIGNLSRSEMPQSPLDPIAHDGIPNRSINNKANACSVIQLGSMNNERRPAYPYATPGCLPEILCAAHSQRSGQHAEGGPHSAGQPGAAFTTPGRNNGAACAGPHPQTETMGTAASPIARLERALAHGRTPTSSECSTNQVRC